MASKELKKEAPMILLVDDAPTNIHTLSSLLDDDYRIKVASSGRDAYQIAKKSMPDLILLDVLMPELDGIDTCIALKHDLHTKEIPIIFVTAQDSAKDEALGFEVGAVDYITKPFNPCVIRARVATHLRLKSLSDNLKKEVEKEVNKRLSTQSKLKEQELILHQQSKLAAMGEMIEAIAHQWRQPLNSLHMRIENLDDDFADGLVTEEFIDDFIKKNQETIMFMSNTIDDFKNFFRKDKSKVRFFVKEAIGSTIHLLSSHLHSKNINIIWQGDDFELHSYKREFQQVVLNILNNAKDALLEKGVKEKIITIKLEEKSIYICDSAGGIDEEILERVFEPYFTTKDEGKGTGIGLYMSKLIIEKNMKGKLSVYNSEKGACFKIDF